MTDRLARLMGDDYTDADFRAVAADYHGGMASHLYRYASTGTVTAALLDEIAALLPEFAADPVADMELLALLTHCEDICPDA